MGSEALDLFIDGALVKSQPGLTVGALDVIRQNLVLAERIVTPQSPPGSPPALVSAERFAGSIDEFRIYNYALQDRFQGGA